MPNLISSVQSADTQKWNHGDCTICLWCKFEQHSSHRVVSNISTDVRLNAYACCRWESRARSPRNSGTERTAAAASLMAATLCHLRAGARPSASSSPTTTCVSGHSLHAHSFLTRARTCQRWVYLLSLIRCNTHIKIPPAPPPSCPVLQKRNMTKRQSSVFLQPS